MMNNSTSFYVVIEYFYYDYFIHFNIINGSLYLKLNINFYIG